MVGYGRRREAGWRFASLACSRTCAQFAKRGAHTGQRLLPLSLRARRPCCGWQLPARGASVPVPRPPGPAPGGPWRRSPRRLLTSNPHHFRPRGPQAPAVGRVERSVRALDARRGAGKAESRAGRRKQRFGGKLMVWGKEDTDLSGGKQDAPQDDDRHARKSSSPGRPDTLFLRARGD